METPDEFYARRFEYWLTHPRAVQPYKFDTRVHYPFGRPLVTEPEVDIVYRATRVYTPDARLQMMQSVASAAASRQENRLADVSASVPKAPLLGSFL